MGKKQLFGLKVLISGGYCMVIAGLIVLMSDLTFTSGMLIGAFITLFIGLASFSNGKSIVPVISKQEQANSIDATGIRASIEMNSQVANAERTLKYVDDSKHINRPDLLKDLFIRRTGIELIIAAVIVAAIAFIPYLKYY